MTSYGFKAYLFSITPPNKPSSLIHFDARGLGDGGCLGLLRRVFSDSVDPGARDGKSSTFTRFDQLRSGGRLLLLDASGGVYGETAVIVDSESGDHRAQLEANHAVLHHARSVFVVPPYGTTGVILSESVGGRIALPSILGRVKSQLREVGAVIRADREIADDLAWSSFLDHDDVGVTGVELTQKGPSNDRTPISESPSVRSAKIIFRLEPHNNLANRLIGAVRTAIGSNQPVSLAPIVGLHSYDDDDFDEQKLVVVVDRKERRINVTRGWPSFTYEIDDAAQPDDAKFMYQCSNVAADLLTAIQVDMPPDWRAIDL